MYTGLLHPEIDQMGVTGRCCAYPLGCVYTRGSPTWRECRSSRAALSGESEEPAGHCCAHTKQLCPDPAWATGKATVWATHRADSPAWIGRGRKYAFIRPLCPNSILAVDSRNNRELVHTYVHTTAPLGTCSWPTTPQALHVPALTPTGMPKPFGTHSTQRSLLHRKTNKFGLMGTIQLM